MEICWFYSGWYYLGNRVAKIHLFLFPTSVTSTKISSKSGEPATFTEWKNMDFQKFSLLLASKSDGPLSSYPMEQCTGLMSLHLPFHIDGRVILFY
jgi:hypothetical protein